MNEEQKEENQQPIVDGQNAEEGIDISKLTAERDEYLDGWKRAKADYDNLVRDTERKRSEFADWATDCLLYTSRCV